MPQSRKRSRSSIREENSISVILRRIEKRLNRVEHQQKRFRSRSPVYSETGSSFSESSVDGESTSDKDSNSIRERGEVLTERNNNENISEQQPDINQEQTGTENRIDEILSIISEEKGTEKMFSEPIQPEIAACWIKILSSGLSEESRTNLIKKYLPPENCLEVIPPKINPEVKIALPENTIRRDGRLVKLQEQVGAASSAAAALLTDMLKEGGGANKKYIEGLNDIGRLLTDIHYSESISRRELLLINLNKDLKDTLKTTPINEWIFGSNLDSTIKTAKDLEKSSEQLKLQKRSVVNVRSVTARQGNYKRPFLKKQGTHQNGQGLRVPHSHRREYLQRSQHSTRKRIRQPPQSERKHHR